MTLSSLGHSLLFCAFLALLWQATRKLTPRLVPVTTSDPVPVIPLMMTGFLLGMLITLIGVLFHIISAWYCLCAAIAIFLASQRLPGEPAPGPSLPSFPLPIAALALAATVPAAVVAVNALAAPPLTYDALTYHLYIPLRWLQDGGLVGIPTVFGDNAAEFAPGNWQLLNVALFELLPADYPFELLAMAAMVLTFAVVVRLTATFEPRFAGLAAFSALFHPLVFRIGLGDWPDLFCCGLLLAGVLFTLQFRERDDSEQALWGFAAYGMAIGTKVAYLPYAGLSALTLTTILLWRRRFRLLAAGLAPSILTGGWWYLRNWFLYGNPLFPVELRIGPWTIFPGAFTREAIEAGEYHIGKTRVLIKHVIANFNSLAMAAPLIGCVGTVALARKPRGPAVLVGLQLAGWTLMYRYVIPHNDQVRFVFPVFILATALGFAWLGRLRYGGVVAWALVVMVLVRFWKYVYNEVHGHSVLYLALCTVAGLTASGCLVLALRRGSHRLTRGLSLTVFALLLTFLCLRGDRQRGLLYEVEYGEVARFINEAEPEGPQTIAYTGLNAPYVFVGKHLNNRVVYVNVQGEPDWGFYDFWKRHPGLQEYHKPGYYRDRPDLATWLRNLQQSRARLLVIQPLSANERQYLASSDGFPRPEYEWARRYDAVFQPRMIRPDGRLYAIDREALARLLASLPGR